MQNKVWDQTNKLKKEIHDIVKKTEKDFITMSHIIFNKRIKTLNSTRSMFTLK